MRIIAAVLAAAAVFTAAGCHGPFHANTYPAGTTTIEHSEKVIFANYFWGKVRLIETNANVLPDGRLEAYAEFENGTGSNLVLQVQTQFKDITGALSKDETNWQTIVMAPHSSTAYRAASMNNQAKDYIIRVKRESND
jgi:hypothetical protein